MQDVPFPLILVTEFCASPTQEEQDDRLTPAWAYATLPVSTILVVKLSPQILMTDFEQASDTRFQLF
jgi:hypothetical protein